MTLKDKVTDTITKALDGLSWKQATCKTEGGACYPASDYAVVPDKEKTSTWKLRLSQGRPGNITISQLGRAAAAFSSGGFRGQKVQLSSGEASSAKARIRREYKKLDVKPENIPDSVKELSFMVWKDTETELYRWFAIYSNNYRDNDNPPEIISEASHKSFVKGVETGIYPYPELWVWHIDGSRVGVSDWLAYTDEGFAVASGTFDKGKEHAAINLTKQIDDLVSHGMPRSFVKRDPNDSSIIIQHITREISPLPGKAAANKLTGFELLSKEEGNMIPEHKRPYLEAVLTEEEIKAIEGNIADKATKAEGLENKDQKPTEQVPESTPPKPEPESEDTEAVRDFAINALAEQVKAIADTVTSLVDVVKELQTTDAEKIAAKAAGTPKSSMQALAEQRYPDLFSKDSQVDGRTSLAKSGPKETDPGEQSGNMPVFFDWMKQDAGGVQ